MAGPFEILQRHKMNYIIQRYFVCFNITAVDSFFLTVHACRKEERGGKELSKDPQRFLKVSLVNFEFKRCRLTVC